MWKAVGTVNSIKGIDGCDLFHIRVWYFHKHSSFQVLGKCFSMFTQFVWSKIKTLEIRGQGTSEGVRGLERLGEVGSEISEFEIGSIPLIDMFHRVYKGMYVWNGTQLYVFYEWVGNNWKASEWQKKWKSRD